MTSEERYRNRRFNATMRSVEALLAAYAKDNTKAAIFSDKGAGCERLYLALDGTSEECAALNRATREYAALCTAAERLRRGGYAPLIPTLWLIYANRSKREYSIEAILFRRRRRGKSCDYNEAKCIYYRHRDALSAIFQFNLTLKKGN